VDLERDGVVSDCCYFSGLIWAARCLQINRLPGGPAHGHGDSIDFVAMAPRGAAHRCVTAAARRGQLGTVVIAPRYGAAAQEE
jgi:hypothetical protein